MSVKKALDYARKARRSAPKELYDVVRNLELALEELAAELGDEKSPSTPRGKGSSLKLFR